MEWDRRLLCLLLAILVTFPLQAQRRSRRSLPDHYRFIQEKEDYPETARAVLSNGLTVLIEERATLPVVALATYVPLDSGPASPSRKRAVEVLQAAAEAARIEARTLENGGLYQFREGESGAAFVTLLPSQNLLDALEIHRDLLKSQPRPLVPKNVVLSAAGTVLRENFLRKVVEFYAPLKSAGSSLRYRPAAPKLGTQFEYKQERARLTQPQVIFSFQAPEPLSPDYLSLNVLRTVLSEGRYSLAERALISQDLAADVQSRWRRSPEGSHLEFVVAAERDRLDAAEVAFLSLLDALRSRPLDNHELNRAKALLLTDYFQQREDLRDRAVIRARHEVSGGSRNIDQPPPALMKLAPKTVQDALKRYLVVPNLTLSERLPLDFEARDFTAETLLQTLQLLLPAQTTEVSDRLDALSPPQDARPLKLPEFKPRIINARLKRTSVLRGPNVYLLEQHRLPLVQIGLALPGGRVQESADTKGITELMLRSLAASAAVTQDPEFWRSIESRGCRATIMNQEDFFGYRFSCLSGGTDRLLGRLVPWFRSAQLDVDTIAREQKRLLSELDEGPGDTLQQGEFDVRRRLFGDHPYAWPPAGSPETVSALSAEAVTQWAVEQVGGYHPTLLVLGDIQGSAFLSPLVGLLSNSKLKKKEAPQVTGPDPKPVAEVELGGARLLAVPGPVMRSRDAWLVGVLKDLLLRLGGEIPTPEGPPAASGLQLDHRSFVAGGLVLAYQRPAVDSRQLRLALARFSAAPIKPQEHLDGLVVAITDFYASRLNSSRRVEELAKNVLAGEAADYENEFLATLKGVELHELRSLARRLFEDIPVHEASSAGSNSEK